MPTVLITGANRGLGYEFARQYAGDGWDVIATCRTVSKADKLQALSNQSGKIRIEPLDTTNATSIAHLTTALKNATLDIIINNAGVIAGNPKASSVADGDPMQDFGTIDANAWMNVLRANTVAPIMMTQALLPMLATQGQRKIVNISSRMGSIALMSSGYIAYRTSKAALNAALAVIASDLKDQGIISANLHPGWVQTDMGSKNAAITPEVSIGGMRKVIAALTLKDSGRFISYDGTTIPW